MVWNVTKMVWKTWTCQEISFSDSAWLRAATLVPSATAYMTIFQQVEWLPVIHTLSLMIPDNHHDNNSNDIKNNYLFWLQRNERTAMFPWIFLNGNWFIQSFNPDFHIGVTVVYECEPGFKPVGATEIICTDPGYWSDYAPKCLPVGQLITIYSCILVLHKCLFYISFYLKLDCMQKTLILPEVLHHQCDLCCFNIYFQNILLRSLWYLFIVPGIWGQNCGGMGRETWGECVSDGWQWVAWSTAWNGQFSGTCMEGHNNGANV